MELKSASNNPVIRLKAVPRALLMALLHYYFNPTVRLSVYPLDDVTPGLAWTYSTVL